MYVENIPNNYFTDQINLLNKYSVLVYSIIFAFFKKKILYLDI